MITARQKVLAYLRKMRSASAREIARALKMSAPTVRHHLGILVSDGRLEMTETRPRGGRGRPEKIFSLSQAALGDNLPALTNALLTEAGSGLNPEALAAHILNDAQFANLPIPKRLALLVERLNEMNYQARWEASGVGPRVIFAHCPYAKVIDGHSEICKMDEALLSAALGRAVTPLSKIEAAGRGGCPFIFQVN